MIFTGFNKCCYPYQKFDSVDGELRLAQILENDASVVRWMKPRPRQFRIEYTNGRNYEPDFVVEMNNGYCLIEPKKPMKSILLKFRPKHGRPCAGVNLPIRMQQRMAEKYGDMRLSHIMKLN